MNESILLQIETGGLTDVQRAVRQRFVEGGSIVTVVLVGAVLIGAMLLTYYLTARQLRARATSLPADPRRLFRDLLDRLGLSTTHRRVLKTVARDLRLEQPTVMLLSQALFDHHVNRWRRDRGPGRPAEAKATADAVSQLRVRLFPSA